MDPKNSLREEHGAIMQMLAVLQKVFVEPMDSKDTIGDDLEALVKFFEIYVDLYHHGKEEQHLFPALSRTRTPGIDSLIDLLIDDHRMAREYWKEIKSHAAAFNPSSTLDCRDVSERAKNYIELVRKHIRVENSKILPLLEEGLCGTEKLVMAGQFRNMEEATLGSSGLQTFLANVHALYQKYCLP